MSKPTETIAPEMLTLFKGRYSDVFDVSENRGHLTFQMNTAKTCENIASDLPKIGMEVVSSGENFTRDGFTVYAKLAKPAPARVA